jgi:hypothetical protein
MLSRRETVNDRCVAREISRPPGIGTRSEHDRVAFQLGVRSGTRIGVASGRKEFPRAFELGGDPKLRPIIFAMLANPLAKVFINKADTRCRIEVSHK